MKLVARFEGFVDCVPTLVWLGKVPVGTELYAKVDTPVLDRAPVIVARPTVDQPRRKSYHKLATTCASAGCALSCAALALSCLSALPPTNKRLGVSKPSVQRLRRGPS